jgi:4-amino-4-deoxy-L-arabinose transferase-like glycosyltransferase
MKFWRVLLVIVLGALALRVGYVMAAKRNEPRLGDQIYYNYTAIQIARGEWFTDPRDGSENAEHPPLTALALAPTSWVAERIDPGGEHLLPQRLTMAVLGAIVVAVIGLVGRVVSGDRAGLVAAGLAAVYPGLWINDGLVMSDTLAALTVATAILLAYRFLRRPTGANAAFLGMACGFAALTRAELLLLVPCMVVPVAIFARTLSVGRRWGMAGVACLATIAVVTPWLAYNLTRFEEPVLFSTNDGLTLCGANLQGTWYGDGTGLWSLECASLPTRPGDRSVVSNDLRRRGLDFIRDHLGRLPVVVAVREARVWSLYAPGAMADYNRGEGREVWASWLAVSAYWALIPFAIGGAVVLRRRALLTPLAAQFAVVVITAAAVYGLVRFRVPAEVSMLVLAAVAVDRLLERARARRAERPAQSRDPSASGRTLSERGQGGTPAIPASRSITRD